MDYQETIERLLTQAEVAGAHYYWLTLKADQRGELHISIQSRWAGYTDDKPRRELRSGRLHFGEEQRAQCHEFGETALLINDEHDLVYFYAFGGHALVVEEVGKRRFKRLVEPHMVLSDSGGVGFRHAGSLSPAELQHAPSKKLRMQVLNRDGKRCVICGRSPMYYVDVELHVHHAIPWGIGGITEEANLITLCKTCHDGLDPHYDQSLTAYLSKKYLRPNIEHFDDLRHYQQIVRSRMALP
jgi:hypothetical protein